VEQVRLFDLEIIDPNLNKDALSISRFASRLNKNFQLSVASCQLPVKKGFIGSFPGIPEAGFACEAHCNESKRACIHTTIFSHEFSQFF